MPYWPPDTPPESPAQMPAAGSGPAPVPYASGDQSAGNPPLPAGAGPALGYAPGAGVLVGVSGNGIQESSLAAPNINPYEAGDVSPIYAGGDSDAGGRDDVAGSVAAAVAAAQARFTELQGDVLTQGSTIGDLMAMPPSHLDPAASSPGTTDPSGGFYDPPRGYGG